MPLYRGKFSRWLGALNQSSLPVSRSDDISPPRPRKGSTTSDVTLAKAVRAQYLVGVNQGIEVNMSVADVRRAIATSGSLEPLVRSDSVAVLAGKSERAMTPLDASDAFESTRAVMNMINMA